jgi:predicted DNA-binding protein with PD1-like motif
MIQARGARNIVARMVDGEDLVEGLLAIEVESAAVLSGIGMVRNARLGYWNGVEYEERCIAEPVELVAMQGNIGSLDGKRIAHCHLTVGRRDGTVAAGHLLGATVVNTAEIVLGVLDGIALERKVEANGLAGLHPRSV